MCGGDRDRSYSNNGDERGGSSKSPRREGMDRARALKVPLTRLENILVPRRHVADTDDHSGVGGDVPRYTGVRYLGSAASRSVRLAREIAPESTLPIGGCDLDDFDVMDFV